jgi:hypothetical protein
MRTCQITVRQRTASGLALLTLATGALTAAEVHAPAVLYLTAAFVLTAPGWALASYLRITPPGLVWPVAVALGLAVAILVAQVMVTAGYWHPWGAMLAFEGLTLTALLPRVARG